MIFVFRIFEAARLAMAVAILFNAAVQFYTPIERIEKYLRKKKLNKQPMLIQDLCLRVVRVGCVLLCCKFGIIYYFFNKYNILIIA